jgi:hypothetical protein
MTTTADSRREIFRVLSDPISFLEAIPELPRNAQDKLTAALGEADLRGIAFGYNAAHEYAQAVRSRYRIAVDADATNDVCYSVVAALERAITDAISLGARDSRVVATCDFQGAIRYLPSQHFMPERPGQPIVFAAGLLGGLVPDSPLLELVPDADRMRFDNTKTGLVLGPVHPATGHARPWYLAEAVSATTKGFRSRQLAEIRDQEERDKIERKNTANLIRLSEIGQLREKLKVLENMEAAGKFDVADREPAVAAIRLPDGAEWRSEIRAMEKAGLLPAGIDDSVEGKQ